MDKLLKFPPLITSPMDPIGTIPVIYPNGMQPVSDRGPVIDPWGVVEPSGSVPIIDPNGIIPVLDPSGFHGGADPNGLYLIAA